MRNLTFQIDYEYCPEGHLDWIFIPSSILYPDVFYCEKCNCFYEPSVRKVKIGQINKDFSSDREADLIKRAKFLKWKNNLQLVDMPPHKEE